MESLWLLAIFFVPLVFVTPGLMSIGYEVPKVTLYRSLVGLAAALWILRWGLISRPITGPVPWLARVSTKEWSFGRPAQWVLVAVCLVIASILVSTLVSPSVSVSLWGAEPALDGYGFYNKASHFILFAMVATHLKTTAQLWRLFSIIIASGVVVGSYGIIQYFGLDPFGVHDGGVRIVSSLGNPIAAGAFLLMVVPITLAVALKHYDLPVSPTGTAL